MAFDPSGRIFVNHEGDKVRLNRKATLKDFPRLNRVSAGPWDREGLGLGQVWIAERIGRCNSDHIVYTFQIKEIPALEM